MSREVLVSEVVEYLVGIYGEPEKRAGFGYRWSEIELLTVGDTITLAWRETSNDKYVVNYLSDAEAFVNRIYSFLKTPLLTTGLNGCINPLNIKKVKIVHINGGEHVFIDLVDRYSEFAPKRNLVMPMDDDRELHYGINKDTGVVSFGIWYFDANRRPGNGGCWSSRPAVVGPMLGLKLVEIAINSCVSYMTTDKLKDILKSQGLNHNYRIVSHVSCGELVHEVKQIKGTQSI